MEKFALVNKYNGLAGYFWPSPTCGILSERCWNLCGFNQHYLCLFHICNLESSCGQTYKQVLSLPFELRFLLKSSGYDGGCRWKVILWIVEILSIHRLSENTFSSHAGHWPDVVRGFSSEASWYQGVFPGLGQHHLPGAQWRLTIQHAHVRGLVNHTQQSMPCGNEASLALASPLLSSFINPKRC